MKKVPTLAQSSYEDKHGRSSVADKILRSKGVKRGTYFYVGDGYLNCREFHLSIDGFLTEVTNYTTLAGSDNIETPIDAETYEYIYKAVILGRGHLWKEKNRIKTK